MLEIKLVNNKRDLLKFVNFPLKLYKNEKNYTPPFIADDLKDFTNKNPSLKYCKTRLFLAFKDKKIVGRIAFVYSPLVNEKYQTKRLRFNHFDVIDDLEVSKALFQKGFEFAKELGLDEIEGPNGFTDMDKEGMLLEGYERRNIFITYYNYPYYIKHMEALGFKKEVDWFEFTLSLPSELDPRLDKIARGIERRGFKVLKFTSHKKLKPYIPKAFEVYNNAFAPLYGTTPLSDELVEYYMGSFLPLLSLDYICIIEDKEHNVCGFAAVVPSLSKASQKCHGKLFPFGFINILHALKHNDTIDMLLIAVKPELQGLGINALLMNEILKACIKHGIKYAETGPELETNLNVQSQWKNYPHELTRKRRLFSIKIDELNLL